MKDVFDFKAIGNWCLRNIVWLLIGGGALYFLNPSYQLLHNLLIIVLLEAMAIGFSGIALFCYTNVNYIKRLVYDKDDLTLTSGEQNASGRVISAVIIAVHILIGLGWYIMQFNEVGIKPQ